MEYEIYNQVVLEGDGGLVNARKREAKNKLYKEMETRQQTCHHPAFHRYGNRHGSYAKCLTRNNTQGWILDGLCSSSQRQPPSPLTTLDGSMGSMAIPPLLGQIDGYRVPIPEGVMVDQQGTRPMPTATRPRPTASDYLEEPHMFRAPRRSRAPSMTSSAAGHGLNNPEEMPDFDDQMSHGAFQYLDDFQPVDSRDLEEVR